MAFFSVHNNTTANYISILLCQIHIPDVSICLIVNFKILAHCKNLQFPLISSLNLSQKQVKVHFDLEFEPFVKKYLKRVTASQNLLHKLNGNVTVISISLTMSLFYSLSFSFHSFFFLLFSKNFPFYILGYTDFV